MVLQITHPKEKEKQIEGKDLLKHGHLNLGFGFWRANLETTVYSLRSSLKSFLVGSAIFSGNLFQQFVVEPPEIIVLPKKQCRNRLQKEKEDWRRSLWTSRQLRILSTAPLFSTSLPMSLRSSFTCTNRFLRKPLFSDPPQFLVNIWNFEYQ